MTTFPRLMLAAPRSGSGKTTLVCGLLLAWQAQGIRPMAFKCGPDYIDPAFHDSVLGVPSRNLDLFFTDEATTKWLLTRHHQQAEAAVLEGVMGYYDGLSGGGTRASSYELARATETPVVLVISCRGASVSVAAQLKGFLTFRTDHHIKGVIFNELSPSLYPELKALVEEELGLAVYGYQPRLADCTLPSRHLGLVGPAEVADLREKWQQLAQAMAQTVDVAGLLALAREAPPLAAAAPALPKPQARVRIAVAWDRAFCFYYADNLELLTRLGAEVVRFSPLEDSALPEDCDGLYLGGGYPELCGEQLAQNEAMRRAIRQALAAGMPALAECGGFMYLQERLQDEAGRWHDMAGVLRGQCTPSGRLRHFGYAQMTALADGLLGDRGSTWPVHEFHYWQSDREGEAFRAKKPCRETAWLCGHSGPRLYAGYPHLYFYGCPELAQRFLAQAAQYQQERGRSSC